MVFTVVTSVIGVRMDSREKIEIWTDGGSRGNPGQAAIGVVLKKDNKVFKKHSECIGIATNNIAEYTAVKVALELFKSILSEKEVIFYLDSELVVKQLNGQYRVKDQNLKVLYLKVRELITDNSIKSTFVHVTRDKNKLADELLNNALDLRKS